MPCVRQEELLPSPLSYELPAGLGECFLVAAKLKCACRRSAFFHWDTQVWICPPELALRRER